MRFPNLEEDIETSTLTGKSRMQCLRLRRWETAQTSAIHCSTIKSGGGAKLVDPPGQALRLTDRRADSPKQKRMFNHQNCYGPLAT